MTLYDLLLFLHVSAAIIWVGSGVLLHFLAFRAERRGDPAALMRVLNDVGSLGSVFFVPASLAAFAFGLALMFVGPWQFSDLWIVIGLTGFLATFAIGFFLLKPRGEALGEIVRRDGGVSAEAMAKARQLTIIGRVDSVFLFLVVAAMTLKPTADSVGVLAAMGAVLVGTVAFGVFSARWAGDAGQEA